MSQDRRRLGAASPTAGYQSGDELTIHDTTCNGALIASVKITGRIRDHSIQVTETESYDKVLRTAKITRVGNEWRYNRDVPTGTKVFRKVDIVKLAQGM
jgi:hypothetical protein